MLQELFPKLYRSYQQSPWAKDLERFAIWLRTAGYSHDSASRHVCRLRHILEYAVDIQPNSVFTTIRLPEVLCSSMSSTVRAARYRATQRSYERFLAAEGRLVVPPTCDRFLAFRLGYQYYLLELRGLNAATIQQHDGTVREFLRRTLGTHDGLADLTESHVERYLIRKSLEVKRQTLQHIVARLRSFLRYSYERGEIRSQLAGRIDTPRTYRGELPPKALEWDVVQELLRSIDRVNRTGWRDYTILYLMAHYGLRPSEIVTLRQDSIDWTTKVLRVEQRKTRSLLNMPLNDHTMGVLRGYLSCGRPGSERPELFLRARSPAGILEGSAVTNIFQKWARRSGLPLDGYTAYCLRHSFAMRLLGRGVGVKAIGDLLGHRSLESTCQYLRLDIDMLRGVALPVPKIELEERSR